MSIDFTSSLNPQQLEAAQTMEGPLLILAGAGCGKTRVIAYRIACMLGRGIPQSSILAVTFTNKAAREMAQRVRTLCRKKLPSLTASTFHAFGVKVLRDCGELLGYKDSFSIYDQADQQALIKEVGRELGISRDSLDPFRLAQFFSALKSGRAAWTEENSSFRPLFDEYQHHLRLFNAVDFEDLILLPLQIFETQPQVLEGYSKRYRYFLVDEFQDTSAQQYQLVRLLAEESRNLCVVGDDDQSIYSWRGANFENILWFERDFPERKEVKLEQNYRSTGRILQAANSLIACNRNRKEKRLWTGLEEGERIQLFLPEDEGEEADLIAETIHSLSLKQRLPLARIGVLVRTNSLTRAIEEAFRKQALPYRVSGGMSFYQRQEVKDIVGYLRVLANPDDDVSLLRILNTPRRGLGRKVLEQVVETSSRLSCSLYSGMAALRQAADSVLSSKQHPALEEFLALIEGYRRRMLSGKKMAASLRSLIEEIDYWSYLVQEHQRQEIARWRYDNVEGLIDSLAAYEEDADNLELSLFGYLNRISLLAREDGQEQEPEDKVNLMTIHAAKGLEFEAVFVAGAEVNLIPHARSISEGDSNLEEERRLFYVAITRAKKRLFLSAARRRRKRGEVQETAPSPFIAEIPAELLEVHRPEEAVAREEALRLLERLKRRLS